MNLHLISFNVQGLNDANAPLRLRNFFQDHIHKLDILCLQKHKLHGQKLQDLGRQLWEDTGFVSCDAAIAYNHQESDPEAGSGGIGTFISPKIKHLIHSFGVVDGNQAFWIQLEGLPGGKLAILNVYALHAPQARIYLWPNLYKRNLELVCQR
jgi:exonuclease III